EPVAQRPEVARRRLVQTGPYRQAFEIVDPSDCRPKLLARARVDQEQLDAVEPAPDPLDVERRRYQPAPKQTRTGRRQGAIDGVEQRARPFTGLRAQELEVRLGSTIDDQKSRGIPVRH